MASTTFQKLFAKSRGVNLTPLMTDILDKKANSKYIYGKLLIRSDLYKGQGSVAENGSTFIALKEEETDQILPHYPEGESLIGKSVAMQPFFFKHNDWTHYNFDLFLPSLNPISTNPLKKLKELFQLKVKQERNDIKSPHSFIFLGPAKGGYTVFANGVKAFISSSHFQYIITKMNKENRVELDKLDLKTKMSRTLGDSLVDELFKFRIPFEWGKMDFIPPKANVNQFAMKRLARHSRSWKSDRFAYAKEANFVVLAKENNKSKR